MISRKVLAVGLSAAYCVSFAWAAEISSSEEVKRLLSQRFPEVKIEEVRPSRIAGMFEVFSADTVAFADAKGEHLFVGQVIDTQTHKELGAQIMDDRHAIMFDSLPFESAIKTVRGDGRRRLAIFADPECPYCHELEKALINIDNLTIYTFLYPLADIHPAAPAKARAIWCSADRSQAWAEWMLKDKLPTADCKNDPLAKNTELGEKLRIGSTPIIYLANGRRLSGARSREQLEQLISEAEAATVAAPGTSPKPATSTGVVSGTN